MELKGRLYHTGQPVRIRVDGKYIGAVEGLEEGQDETGELPWIAPGLVDVQVNGYGGQEFNAADIDPEKIGRIVDQLSPFGVTQLCPTVTTEGFDRLALAMRALDRACQGDPHVAHAVPGIHLEGPYISAEDGCRGAHPRVHCRPPDWDEFQRLQEAAGGRIRIVTLAAEYPQSPEFIRKAAASGVVVALGHTSATPDDVRAAVDAGARLSTHLGNGSHQVLPRHPNYLWSQLAEDRLWASLIVDGHHLPPEVVKVFVRAKGFDRCLLVSDLCGLAGLPPGRYRSNLCEIDILPEGKLAVAGQQKILAGAGLPISIGIGNLIDFAGATLTQAIEAATLRPAQMLGLPPTRLEAGQPADIVLFRLAATDGGQPMKFIPTQVVSDGRWAFSEPSGVA